MTVVRPNSISGINSITVATGEALQVHAANGDIVSTIVSSSGIATYKAIHVGSGTTTSNQGVIVGTGASIVSDAVNQLDVYTNNAKRLSIDPNGLVAISTNGLAPSSYGSPSVLVAGNDSTLTLMGNGSTNSSSYTGIKFRIAGGSTGDYTKAGIFSRREGGYNDLSLIFALDTVADATSVSIADEKMRITSAGRVNIVGICSAAGGFVGDGSNLTNISGIPSESDTSVSSTSATTVATLSASTYRAAVIDVVITQGSAYQAGTYGLIHDGTTATIVEQWAIATGDMLGTFTATVSGGNMLMQVNMGSSSSATVTVKSSTITV